MPIAPPSILLLAPAVLFFRGCYVAQHMIRVLVKEGVWRRRREAQEEKECACLCVVRETDSVIVITFFGQMNAW